MVCDSLAYSLVLKVLAPRLVPQHKRAITSAISFFHGTRRDVRTFRTRLYFPSLFSPFLSHFSNIGHALNYSKDVDKGKSNASSGATGRKPLLGGAFGGSFGGGGASSAPLEFTPILNSHKGLILKNSSATIAVSSANSEYQKQFDTDTLPVAPVYAARLSSLLKTLDSAHIAVKGAIEARETHIRNLERLLSQSKMALENDKNTLKDIVTKHQKTETTKQEVEMMILKGMDEPQNNQTNGGGGGAAGSSAEHDAASPKSPEVEALTPPGQPAYDNPMSAASTSVLPPQFHQGASELLASLAAPLSGVKREKRDEPEVFEGLDDDVADMFRNEQMGSPAKRSKIEDDDEYHP